MGWLFDLCKSFYWAAVCYFKGWNKLYNFEFKNGDYTVKPITCYKDMWEIFRGRYLAFQHGYMKRPSFGIDANKIDLNSYHLGCFDAKGVLCGYYRITCGYKDAEFAYQNSFVFMPDNTSLKLMEAARAYIPKSHRGLSSLKILKSLWFAIESLAKVKSVDLIVGRGSIQCSGDEAVALANYFKDSKLTTNVHVGLPKKGLNPKVSATNNKFPTQHIRKLVPPLLSKYFSYGVKVSEGPAAWNPQLHFYDFFIVCDLKVSKFKTN
jgi:hypothetical protein